jgi:AcrR family transcriptional regulator
MSGNTKEIIFNVAKKHFSMHGFEGSRMDVIAQEAGINKATIYYYYDSKESLYEEVLGCVVGDAAQRIALAVMCEEDILLRLRAFIRALHKVKHDIPEYAAIFMMELGKGGPNLPKKVMRGLGGIMGMFRTILKDGVREGVFRDVNPVLAYFIILGSSLLFHTARPKLVMAAEMGIFPKPELPELDYNLTSEIVMDVLTKGLLVHK